MSNNGKDDGLFHDAFSRDISLQSSGYKCKKRSVKKAIFPDYNSLLEVNWSGIKNSSKINSSSAKSVKIILRKWLHEKLGRHFKSECLLGVGVTTAAVLEGSFIVLRGRWILSFGWRFWGSVNSKNDLHYLSLKYYWNNKPTTSLFFLLDYYFLLRPHDFFPICITE